MEERKDNIHDYIKSYVDNSSVGLKKKVVKATIKEIQSDDFVVVDAGLKSEGLIPMKEFFQVGEKESLQVGQEISVYILGKEKEGKALLSREKAIKEETLKELEECFETGQKCKGIVFGKVKGGLSMDIKGVIAFLPGSQIDFEAVKDVSYLMGKEIECKVLKIQTKGQQTVIVSRKAVLEDESRNDREGFVNSIKEGDVVKGVVKNITEYGVFVRLHYGVDGLVHINDISWEKILHPSEVLELNQEITVKVLKIDDTNKISLGIKQLKSNPWDEIKDKFPIGKNLDITISEINSYEALCELDENIEGVLNENNLKWGRLESVEAFKNLKPRDSLKVQVIDIDTDKHQIKLSAKHLTPNISDKFLENKAINDIFEGEIISVTEFGVFVKLAESVEGKISNSDITWNRDYKKELQTMNVGDTIKVVYLGKGMSNIKLGIKQLTKPPFEKHLFNVKVGDIVTVEVIDNKDRRSLEVKLFDEITAYIRSEELALEIGDRKTNRFVVGTRIDAKIIMLDVKAKKIHLSIKALEEEKYKNTLKKYGSSESGASLAHVLGDITGYKDEE